MKQQLKKLYYAFQPKAQLKDIDLQLGYIFHTERIYDDGIYKQLIDFCHRYQEMTGARPICAIIPPTNALLAREMQEVGFSEQDFISRLNELQELATLGYHGHFYMQDDPVYHNGIHCNSYVQEDMTSQFLRDLRWFEEHGFSHNGIYAAGWWFTHPHLMELLIENGFRYDFSFSKSPYFYSAYSAQMMQLHDIRCGEIFELGREDGPQLTCIQNFIGMHTTPFPEDFDRNMKLILDEVQRAVGVVNAHDYDLDFENTLRCISYQMEVNRAHFLSFEELAQVPATKSIKL